MFLQNGFTLPSDKKNKSKEIPLILSFEGSFLGENIFFVLFILILIFAVIFYFWRKHKILESKKDPLSTKSVIVGILSDAKESNLTCEMSLVKDTKPLNWNIKGNIQVIHAKNFVCSTNYIISSPTKESELQFDSQLVGREIVFHLKFRSAGEPVFYEFRSTLLKYKTTGKHVYFEMSIPDKLSQNQRRGFARYKPPKSGVLALALWHLDSKTLPQHPTSLSLPLLSFRKGKNEDISVVDISGSGIKLNLNKMRLTEKSIKFEKKEPCILLLSLLHLDTQSILNVWIVMAVRHIDIEPSTPSMGCQFLYWASHPKQHEVAMQWKKIEDTGEIPVVLDWVNNTIRFVRYQEKLKHDINDSLYTCKSPKDF